MRRIRAWIASIAMVVAGIGGARAQTTHITPSMSTATVQSTLTGNTNQIVQFDAGTYNFTSSYITFPCNAGVLYEGPPVGLITPTNLPTATINLFSATAFQFETTGSVAATQNYSPGVTGCAFEYFTFSGTGGSIYVPYPSGGVLLANNYVTGNNPSVPASGNFYESSFWFDGSASTADAAHGTSYDQVINNLAVGNCTNIINNEGPTDQGGLCDLTSVKAYSNNFVWSNNTINGIEEGFKGIEQSFTSPYMLNFTATGNNMQGVSRICMEIQQVTNGSANVSHNSCYQPLKPSNLTFGFSLPSGSGCTGPCWTIHDNANINGVFVYESGSTTGSGAHYGIGFEPWGAGSDMQYNLLQGGNQADSCGGGGNCSTGAVALGGSYSINAVIKNNIGSGTSLWNGSSSNLAKFLYYEDGASSGLSGLVNTPNTIYQTSTTMPTQAPSISPASGAFTSAPTVTLSDSDVNHALTIFYTVDGSTPCIFAPGGSCGTTQIYTAPFTAPSTGTSATIKTLAHWGQGANQGIVFPQFGWVPSSVVTATYSYTQTAAPAFSLAGSYYVMPQNLTLTDSTTGSSILWCYTGSGTCTPATAYTAPIYINPAVGVADIICASATSTGNTPSPVVCMTYYALALTGVALTAPAGLTLWPTGQTQLVATCTYSDASTTNCTTTDSHGNGVSSYNNGTPATASVSTGGLVYANAVGTTSISAVVGTITSPSINASVVAPTASLNSAALSTTGGVIYIPIGATNQIKATCTYSDAVVTDCTVNDIRGSATSGWGSSNGNASISSSGLATGVAAGTVSFSATVTQ